MYYYFFPLQALYHIPLLHHGMREQKGSDDHLLRWPNNQHVLPIKDKINNLSRSLATRHTLFKYAMDVYEVPKLIPMIAFESLMTKRCKEEVKDFFLLEEAHFDIGAVSTNQLP